MLCRIALPRIPDVGWRLQQAFGDTLFIQLDGAGWSHQGQRCYAAVPSETLAIGPTESPHVWQTWRERLRSHPSFPQSHGFLPGWFGYLGYEAGRTPRKSATYSTPIAVMGFFPCIVTETDDHTVICHLPDHAATAEKIMRALVVEVTSINCSLLAPFTADADATAYRLAFERINHYIHAGDCYQVNFAQRFSAPYQGNPYAAYSRIQNVMQSPFCGFVRHDTGCILSFSPEQFLQVHSGRMRTSPIKGTRPRYPDAQHDAASADTLRHSSKDQAENVMIVDLLRNDLSKVAMLGSVTVPQLFAIESFPHVHHMVSTIEAKLRPELTPVDVIEACFPGGSITGAPKRRACEIIDELEPFARSAYCGSLFYLDVAGNLQSNILIRTLTAENAHLYCWGGGGIVADSDCQAEFDETLHKVGQLMRLFETS